jgi:hypothetical protein
VKRGRAKTDMAYLSGDGHQSIGVWIETHRWAVNEIMAVFTKSGFEI